MQSLPLGFRMTGLRCGIKPAADKLDLTLIVADEDATAAGVYTQNLVYAAPVAIDRERTPSRRARAVVVNSGNANACTGQRGLDDARRMAQVTAEAIGVEAEQVLVMSTGVIGQFLPMDKIEAGVRNAASQLGHTGEDFVLAARGICTTDKSHKIATREFQLAGRTVRIAGMAKGAGMIGPRMATMLAVIMTDARLEPIDAQYALSEAVNESFNCISVDGHMSTNDTVLLLASGAAMDEPLPSSEGFVFFRELRELCVELAKQIPDDGEGASHLMCIHVRGCICDADARRIAQTVAESPLVKTAVAGNDPNWGRIVSAAGYAGVSFDPDRLELRLNGTLLYRDGAPQPFDDPAVSRSMRESRETRIELNLHLGGAEANFWASDLTHEYVRINADYRT
ncbi:MAG: bifunctional glutamate N-acetyltransferase/amino-acid acetyltransferase ArgJ [Planctomycetales bacterium]|nr:bifunctional glutamate N-acetyltransferase/amino-acid acetyltransferase ArgJ [Planctomycetales bacterium]